MNKARRNELKMLHWKRKLKLYVPKWNGYLTRQGLIIQHPKVVDIIKDNGQLHYKEDRCPCSCYACQQIENNYNRAKQKHQLRKYFSAVAYDNDNITCMEYVC